MIENDDNIDDIMEKYRYAKQILETQIDILMNDFARKHGYNPVEHVKGRLKSVDSIKSKLRKKNKEFTKENINKHVKDIVGVRIVCSFLSDVFDIVSVINRSPNIIVKQREDYIANPKDTCI